MSSFELLSIQVIFWEVLLILPVLKILQVLRFRMPIYSAFFQILHAGHCCIFMLSLESSQYVQESILLMPWLPGVNFSLYLDKLTFVMMILISSVSSCVQLYSIGYMESEERIDRFFWLLTFFSTMMQILVCSGNFLMLFLAWEGIGVASFLLIGFYRDAEALKNSVVALIVNRLGDAGVLLGCIAIFSQYHTLDYDFFLQNNKILSDWMIAPILLGVLIKSAQWPFHFWLPGSMSAPTPVSALLHAATLVTAGVFLLSRLFPLMSETSYLWIVVQVCASLNIFWLAAVALMQSNIKRMIAYSTLSQLGYMMLALSLGAPHLALFHLWTHGFFKALLFLIAGTAAHRAFGSLLLSDMKGVFSRDPLMIILTIIAIFSLAGVVGFAGFYSKERILHWVLEHDTHWAISLAVVLGTLLTTMYCARLAAILLASTDCIKKWHSSSPILIPGMVVLAAMTLWSGHLGESPFFGILAPADMRSWDFIDQSLVNGWAILFTGLFFIAFRLLLKLNGVFPLRPAIEVVLNKIELEFGYPRIVSSVSYSVYKYFSFHIHRLQSIYIEEGYAKIITSLVTQGSNQVIRQQTGRIKVSLMQTLWVGLGVFCIFWLKGISL